MEDPIFREGGWAERWTCQFLSILRIITALLFLHHGTSKILGFPYTSMSFPPPWTQFWMAGMLELVGGTLLLIGFLTRPVAFLLAGEMAVAYWMIHAPESFWPVVNRGEAAILFCFIFLYVVFAGPGPWSVDAVMRKRRLEEGPDSYYEGTHHEAGRREPAE